MKTTLIMKKISALAIVLIISIAACAQTSLDSALFNKINEYRVSKKIKEIILDPANTSGGGSNAYTIREQGIRGIKNYVIISTFVFI